ncbi:putative calcium-binding protein CML43 [Acorus calamus]|uniref:Calcium-binding protein CML43 n=1 Tax=Acorus calamus TaxID=4465 RepID=A0AAV9D054_ACOCL|nr:putative calcium-binding protein CML43 [Acorus calamus]
MDEHKCEWFVTVSDIETVIKKLGIYSPSEQLESENDEKCRDCRILEVVTHILEEDEASTEELNQAFSVYDENGDGFISAPELQKVMRRLGMEEGVELENCEKMIAAFDVDGDGRIDLLEFTRMLENQR